MATDVHKLLVIGSTAGEYNTCVLHFQGAQSSSPTPEADSNALCAAFNTNVLPAWLACGATDYFVAGVKAQRVNNTGGPSSVILQNPVAPGTVTGTSTPQQSAQLFTGDYYDAGGDPVRWRAGKFFYPSVPENGYTAPNYTNAQATLQNSLITILNNGFGSSPTGPWVSGIWSRKEQVFYPVNWEVSLLVGTIKKRLHPVL